MERPDRQQHAPRVPLRLDEPPPSREQYAVPVDVRRTRSGSPLGHARTGLGRSGSVPKPGAETGLEGGALFNGARDKAADAEPGDPGGRVEEDVVADPDQARLGAGTEHREETERGGERGLSGGCIDEHGASVVLHLSVSHTQSTVALLGLCAGDFDWSGRKWCDRGLSKRTQSAAEATRAVGLHQDLKMSQFFSQAPFEHANEKRRDCCTDRVNYFGRWEAERRG